MEEMLTYAILLSEQLVPESECIAYGKVFQRTSKIMSWQSLEIFSFFSLIGKSPEVILDIVK